MLNKNKDTNYTHMHQLVSFPILEYFVVPLEARLRATSRKLFGKREKTMHRGEKKKEI